MKQKRIRVVLLFIMMVVLTACGMEVSEGEVNPDYVQISDIEFIDASIEKSEDSDIAIYQTKIKNNSNQIIKGVSIEVLLDDGRHTNLVTHDTLRPDDISSWIYCVGPSSLDLEDIQMTRFTVQVLDENQQKMVITYDVSRDFYAYELQNDENKFEPLVTVEDIKFVYPILVESEDEVINFQTYLKNESDYDLQSITYVFEDENGQSYTLFNPLTIDSHDRSSLLTTSFLPSTDWSFYEFKRIDYTYMDENELVKVTYDVRLKQYFRA